METEHEKLLESGNGLRFFKTRIERLAEVRAM